MRPNPFYFVLALALSLSSCSNSRSSESTSNLGTKPIETGPSIAGDNWLKWDKSSRLAFVIGNLRGYWDGLGAGCGEAKILAKSLSGVSGLTEEVVEQMRFRCVNKLKLSSRSFESYEEVITQFYNQYPEDKSVEVQDIMQLLAYDSDDKLTPDELHKLIKIVH